MEGERGIGREGGGGELICLREYKMVRQQQDTKRMWHILRGQVGKQHHRGYITQSTEAVNGTVNTD